MKSKSKSKSRIDLYFIDVIKGMLDKYPELIAFLIVSATILWLNLYRNTYAFYYDSQTYWDLRLQFDQQHTVDFSLLNYHQSLRSYLLPLIHYIISKSASVIGLRDVVLLEVIQALVFSSLITIIIPRVIKMLFNKTVYFWQIIVFSLLVVFFWQGYFYYPLSDFWALFFFIVGVYILLRCHTIWWALLIVGTCWGAAFLVRPSYAPSIVLLFFWGIFYFYKILNLKTLQITFNVIFITLGLIGIFLPQLMINITHFNKFSPAPQTEEVYGANLFMKQLGWGIDIQRYETFVGSSADYITPGVIFDDPQGTNLLTRSGLGPFRVGASGSILTLSEYVSLIFSHPLDFFVLYLRHLFNGLDIVYNTPYIYDLYQNTIQIRLLNYSLWFLTVVFVIKRVKASIVFSYQFLLLLIFIIPSILSIPTAIEIRFMLPFYFIAYLIVVFGLLPLFISFARKKQIDLMLKYAPWYIAFVSICLTLSMNTFSNLKAGTYIFW